MLHATFVEERNQFRQNVEMAHRMRADIAKIRQQLNKYLVTVDQPMIGRQCPVRKRTPDRVCQEPATSQTIPPDELYLFLSALSDLEEKY